jgi:hypothetical protein
MEYLLTVKGSGRFPLNDLIRITTTGIYAKAYDFKKHIGDFKCVYGNIGMHEDKLTLVVSKQKAPQLKKFSIQDGTGLSIRTFGFKVMLEYVGNYGIASVTEKENGVFYLELEKSLC